MFSLLFFIIFIRKSVPKSHTKDARDDDLADH
jgi:hypothetical protein